MKNFLEALNRPADAYRRQSRAVAWLFVAATIIIVTVLDPILHYFSNPGYHADLFHIFRTALWGIAGYLLISCIPVSYTHLDVYRRQVYLFALFRSRRRIRTMKICDLIYSDRQNEKELLKKSRSRRKIFVISIISGLIGTILLLLRNLPLGILGSACIIVFLYGFFISFSSGVPAYFGKRPGKKYKGHTLLIFRTLSAKLATMGVVMATIALLLTATLITEGAGMLFHVLLQDRNEQTTCFDLFISSSGRDSTRFDEYLAYIDGNVPVSYTHLDVYKRQPYIFL